MPLHRLTRLNRLFLAVSLPAIAATGGGLFGTSPVVAQAAATDEAELCNQPVLSRLGQHAVTAGENLAGVANRYGLTAATLMGFNASARGGAIRPGQTLVIPPYNGIRIDGRGRTWEDLSAQYKVRPDVLFEVNGCVTQPAMAFVPGVKWVPGIETAVIAEPESPTPSQAPVLSGYPLQTPISLLLNYGWQLNPVLNQVLFHGGIDIAAPVGSVVTAVGDGIVAYAAEQGEYGKLVVINHASGLQSRYAQLSQIQVNVGQTVQQDTVLGAVGQTGKPSNQAPHLHFEVRLNSSLGWVAQDPMSFLSERVGLGE